MVISILGLLGWSLRMLSNFTCSLLRESASIHRVTVESDAATRAAM